MENKGAIMELAAQLGKLIKEDGRVKELATKYFYSHRIISVCRGNSKRRTSLSRTAENNTTGRKRAYIPHCR